MDEAIVVYGPPDVRLRLTLYDEAPFSEVQLRDTSEAPGVAVRPATVAGAGIDVADHAPVGTTNRYTEPGGMVKL